MQRNVQELLPTPGIEHSLTGLYLRHRLHEGNPEDVMVYSNYVTSLDGRIALPEAGHASHQVPRTIANARDWRLYQELAAQADLLITSARYFRQAASAEHQDQLPVGQGEEFADLRAWRQAQGLSPQPDIVVLSGSLDIPVAALQAYPQRRVFIATGQAADRARADALARASGATVLFAGDGERVDGRALVAQLRQAGYRSLYAIAGPEVLHTLVRAQVLKRLYLTTAHHLLGGTRFDTIHWGPVLDNPVAMHLRELYFDPHAPAPSGQMFATYDCQYDDPL